MTDFRKYFAKHTLVRAAAIGIAYYLLASPLAHFSPAGAITAIVWPAPPIAIVALWLQPVRRWPLCLLAVFVAMTVVGAQNPLSATANLSFAALNVIEVALLAWLGQRYVSRTGILSSTIGLLRFLLLLPLASIAFVAALGATLTYVAMGAGWWLEWRTLMVGNGVAVLVLIPALFAWLHRGDENADACKTTNLSTAVGVAAIVATLGAAVVLSMPASILRMLLALILSGVAIHGGVRSAALVVGVMAVLSIVLTTLNLGPYWNDGTESVWELQVDIAGLTMLSLFVATAVDERRQLMLRLERARRLESLGLLAGGIAHDFNNILGAVSGYAEIAASRLCDGSRALAPLHEVVAASERGRDLTRQILLAARRGERSRNVLDLHDIARTALGLARPLCPAGIELVLEPAPEPLLVAAHQDQMVRATLNLIRNSSQAAKKRVTVRLAHTVSPEERPAIGDTPAGSCASIEVEDDGAGIAPDTLPHIFDPFFTTRGGPGGTGNGLGLAIVAGIACEHQGAVSIASRVGCTRFRLLLPIVPAAPREAASAAVPAPAALGDGQQVMLVDDDLPTRKRCEDWLAELGFEPLGFDDPLEALAHAEATPNAVALLLTDLDMPTMRGNELAKRIRLRAPTLPVILCSGHPSLADIAHAAGAAALPKPFDRDALARAAAAALATDTTQ